MDGYHGFIVFFRMAEPFFRRKKSDIGWGRRQSPRCYFSTLIIIGIFVLVERKIKLKNIILNNQFMAIFFLYCFLSIIWSDLPFIAIKRYIKVLGHPIMALIILSDPSPDKALRVVMKRCAYFLIPFSVLFIKYYPEYGRGFDPWTGEGGNNGIMHNKNELGYVCMLFGIFFIWDLLTGIPPLNSTDKRNEFLIKTIFLCMILWLLHMANSSTSLVTFLIGSTTVGLLGFRIVSKRYFTTYFLSAIVIIVVLESIFDLYKNILDLLGEDSTLTDRTKVWADSLALVSNPLIGEGFESFWLGERLEVLWRKWWWRPNQAHNGYIETYLNLGFIGIFLLLGVIISTYRKICKNLLTDFDFARLQLAYLFAILFYNYAEATFKGVHLVWTIFHIIAIDYPKNIFSETRKQSIIKPPLIKTSIRQFSRKKIVNRE